MSGALLATYLVNKPNGPPLVYLVIAITLFVVALVVAGYTRDIYRAVAAAGLAFLVLALLTH
jgi:hypothetical protein